ncbi:MAG: family 78 glycoside hydrolase catalytic domain [Armatimonadetes bacterium]|nr:family 78 glycoside hydrolase catalytic domain [Armatimonadota bacterium]
MSPLGIDAKRPLLSWQMQETERGALQSAYRIQVATGPQSLVAGKSVVWDSGKVESANSLSVPCEASALLSAQAYWWRVKIWDGHGRESEWSSPASFEMGLLRPGDWRGKWIGAPPGGKGDGPAAAAESQIAPQLRTEIVLDKPIRRARAYVCGLGYYELRINGEKVGDRVLDPSYTNFDRRALYSAYDVTDALREGKNAVGAILGKGWFSQNLCLLLQINVDYTDGTHASFATDESWKWSTSPILMNSLYNGETYDARLEQSGWDMPGFDDSAWRGVVLCDSPTKLLSAQEIQPVRVTETLPFKSMKEVKPGVWVFDFGQNFSGWCQLRVAGPAGQEVKLRYAEILHPDGSVNQENLRSAKATDTYILKGSGQEIYEPRFTYHGFRYVQIEGYPGRPEGSDVVKGRLVHTDFSPRGEFSCSNELINQIQHNSVWGFKTNFHSIPTDCPQRDERQGWMGDAGMTCDAGCYNFNMGAAFTKFAQDIQDSQGADGRIPDTVPHVWGTDVGDPMWSVAYHLIVWNVYRHDGDRALLEKHYDGLKRYVDFVKSGSPGYIYTHNNYGDWVGLVETPKDLISTGCFYFVSKLVSEMAQQLGRLDDQRTYAELCGKIAEAFNSKFFDPQTNVYGNGSQFSYIWPLYLQIVPQAHRAAVVDNLVHDIMVTHKGHLSTGFPGTRYLFEALCNEGRPDVAYTVATQPDYPGYGYMIANGATTIWELWKRETGPGMNSHNHPAFGFISGWFYSHMAGIVPDWRYPGYERFDVKPYLMGDLNEAQASVDTARGRVASHWKRDSSGVTLNVTVPANAQARVWAPKTAPGAATVTEGGRPVWKNSSFNAVTGVTSAQDAGEWVRLEVGSGSYSFHISAER